MLLELCINGETRRVETEGNKTLLYVLREKLGLTGAKCGCATGDCGACRVIVDGVAENACTLLAKNLEGKRIETIEGLSAGGGLHPIQRAFIACGAIQCGYCTPGMILSAKALLDRCPRPTDAQIKAALDPNLCRCTGYYKIIEAVRHAAALLEEERHAG